MVPPMSDATRPNATVAIGNVSFANDRPIALFAGENPDIYLRLLDLLAMLARRAHRPGDTAAILEAAAWVRERASKRIEEVQHRRRLDAAWRGVGDEPAAGPRRMV